MDGLELNKTALDTVEAKKLAQRLREVTGHTDHYFSQDVRVTARLLAHLLAFESHQQGFGLTATQDAHFNEVGLCPVLSSPWPQTLSSGSPAQASPGPGEVKALGFPSLVYPIPIPLPAPLSTWPDLSGLPCPLTKPHLAEPTFLPLLPESAVGRLCPARS